VNAQTASELLSDMRRAIGRHSTWGFHRVYMEVEIPEEDYADGGDWLWHLGAWIDEAMKPGGKLVGAVPRDHVKTTLGTTTCVVRSICYMLKFNIAVVGANDIEAQSKARNIINPLENNKLIIQDFGETVRPRKSTISNLQLKYTDKKAIFNNGVQLIARAMLGKIRGTQGLNNRRIDLFIFDDIEEDLSVESKEQRRKQSRWLKSACFNSMSRMRGSIVWLGTVLHGESLLSQWIDHHAEFRRFKLPAYNVRNHQLLWMAPGECLWGEYWTREMLAAKEREIGAATFSKEFLNTPLSDEDQVFRSEWWRFYRRSDLLFESGRWHAPSIDGQSYVPMLVFAAVDPAISQSKDADYFAYIVVGRADMPDRPRYYVLEIFKARLSVQGQVDHIKSFNTRWSPVVTRIEDVAYQAALKQLVQEEGINAEGIKHRQHKETRIAASAVPVERGDVYLPMGEKATEDFMAECEIFPVGATDDYPDAWAMAVERAQQGINSKPWASKNKRVGLELVSGF